MLPAARYYVTMDMLRRVMEAHFGYRIEYVMNVTDIDDKIIKNARLNYLRDQYMSSTPDDSKVDILAMAFCNLLRKVASSAPDPCRQSKCLRLLHSTSQATTEVCMQYHAKLA